MINPEKVQAMAQISLYEKNEGRAALKLKAYCEDIPLWRSLSQNALGGILLCLLITLIAFLGNPDWFASVTDRLGLVLTVVLAAVALAVFAVVYSIITDIIIRRQYKRQRSTLCRYRADVRHLEHIQNVQEDAERVD